MNLVYICSGISSVFDSQVLALLRNYVENDIFDEVILLFGYRNNIEKKRLSQKQLGKIKVVYFKTFPNYPFYNLLLRKKLYNAIRSLNHDFTNYFFHIRGEIMSYFFKQVIHKMNIQTNQLLTDIRGAGIQEIEEFANLGVAKKRLKLRNYRRSFTALKLDSKISVVSDSLKRLLSSLKMPSQNIAVNHCLVNELFRYDSESREDIRKNFRINKDEILLIFSSGGTANWQNNEIIISLANKGIKVLNLSQKEIQHKNIINKFVSYQDVYKYLSAADCAFIWRDKSIVNEVASPVKFSEYMACGLPVVHNGTVDLITNITEEGVDGMLIESISDIEVQTIKRFLLNSDRQKISAKGLGFFEINKIVLSYKQIYAEFRNS